jgi:hypothetical protein
MDAPVPSTKADVAHADDDLSTLLATRPLKLLDESLTALAILKQQRPHIKEKIFLERESKHIELFARAALAASGFNNGHHDGSSPINQLFSSSHANPRKKELALFLVRLLVRYPDVCKIPLISFRMFE